MSTRQFISSHFIPPCTNNKLFSRAEGGGGGGPKNFRLKTLRTIGHVPLSTSNII